jgi:hypothetical protein
MNETDKVRRDFPFLHFERSLGFELTHFLPIYRGAPIYLSAGLKRNAGKGGILGLAVLAVVGLIAWLTTPSQNPSAGSESKKRVPVPSVVLSLCRSTSSGDFTDDLPSTGPRSYTGSSEVEIALASSYTYPPCLHSQSTTLADPIPGSPIETTVQDMATIRGSCMAIVYRCGPVCTFFVIRPYTLYSYAIVSVFLPDLMTRYFLGARHVLSP